MADTIHVAPVGDGGLSGGYTGAAGDTTRLIDPDHPDAARQQIQETRARISGTIDEIEEVLLHKKEQLQERMDVFAPVRERPMQVLGAVFGAALLLGFLTGGDDDDGDHLDSDFEDSAELWESRARRLLRIAREQEQELRMLRARHAPLRERPWGEGEGEHEDESDGGLGDFASERLTGVVASGVQRLIRGLLG